MTEGEEEVEKRGERSFLEGRGKKKEDGEKGVSDLSVKRET